MQARFAEALGCTAIPPARPPPPRRAVCNDPRAGPQQGRSRAKGAACRPRQATVLHPPAKAVRGQRKGGGAGRLTHSPAARCGASCPPPRARTDRPRPAPPRAARAGQHRGGVKGHGPCPAPVAHPRQRQMPRPAEDDLGRLQRHMGGHLATARHPRRCRSGEPGVSHRSPRLRPAPAPVPRSGRRAWHARSSSGRHDRGGRSGRARAGRGGGRCRLSYAGRTAAPVAQPLPQRVGGFGGVRGAGAITCGPADHPCGRRHPPLCRHGCRANAVAACAATGTAAGGL
jgi:hypothetical protein